MSDETKTQELTRREQEAIEITEIDEAWLDDVAGGGILDFGCGPVTNFGCGKVVQKVP